MAFALNLDPAYVGSMQIVRYIGIPCYAACRQMA